VAINLSAGSKTLSTGTAEMVTGKVSGLTGLEMPLSLTLKNNTPAVTLQGGNTQEVTIAPSNVLADGTYSFERDITAETPGTFDVTATLDVPFAPGPGGPVSEGPPVIGEGGKAPKCQGTTCGGRVYYKIKGTPTVTSITDSATGATVDAGELHNKLITEIGHQQLAEDLKASLQKSGYVTQACAQGCQCDCKPPKWSDDDKKGKNSGTDSVSATLKANTLGSGNYNVTFQVNYTAMQVVSGKCQ
jgi:hypothetical protein